ncbi:hypothetical protein ABMA28_008402 [Loxostege sticticalis]|uniref:Uncharacterized protein n=1 Tax=Loxostege sticticalis TaxID=481309 RepID=A0ABD0SHF3_LOXSC
MGSIHSTKIQRFHRHFRYGAHLIESEVDAIARPMRIAKHASLSYQVFPAFPQAPPSPRTRSDEGQRFPRVTSASSRRRFYVGFLAKILNSFYNNYS